MANWCNNYIEVIGKTKEVKYYFSEMLESQKLANESDFGKCWLGNLLDYAGLANPYDTTSYNCRGYYSIDDEEMVMELDSESEKEITLTITAESAWDSCGDIFVEFAEAINADVQVYWTSEEFGNGYFETNDPEVAKTIVIDYQIDFDNDQCPKLRELLDYGPNYGYTKEMFLEGLKKKNIISEEINDFDKAIEILQEKVDIEVFYY